ncbi:MAG: tRNA (adenosine(37)-N6)-threonylcarbamoyltransferase complex dimerization subunit type 1 TsaB [Candidatus Latescibacteria bacterium]|nr:tRNA (adenosine(37)-N6)-threonylcarbamoyltransferase complex dimerization subunit type 1 TsaB [bacterium]MBD3425048.1 tRNA (adenosine(37)-N6)-threonylcarbamoyltransferase complex dimerization subunit type 1 TsaB [Candidatus Latescibacterota bacterium]
MKNRSLQISLDSSHLRGSVAVSDHSGLLSGVFFDASDTHSATLLPAVDSSLRMAGVELSEIESFAVVIGPGSFTGLRIGLSTIKAFASVRQKPVYTVSSLELLASAFPYCQLPVASIIDARRNEVYFALYSTGSGMPEEIVAPGAVKPAEISGIVSSRCGSRKVIACGTGACRYREIFSSRGIIFADINRTYPSASLMAALTDGSRPVDFEQLAGLEPLYIRPPDARPSVKLMDKRG